MNTLTIPLPLLRRLIRELARMPDRIVWLRVGHHSTPHGAEWLGRDLVLQGTYEGRNSGPYFVVQGVRSSPVWPPEHMVSDPLGYLFLGIGDRAGSIWGAVRSGAGYALLDQIHIVGAGMYYLRSAPLPGVHLAGAPTLPVPSLDTSRWSRTIGALGSKAAWERLIRLPMTIVGCGRIGSLVATALGRLGVQRIVLIDPDRVERHNLGEMDGVTERHVGQFKVMALAEYLGALCDPYPIDIIPIPSPLKGDTFRLVVDSKVIFCCADADSARLLAAILATSYHRVLVDIGTAVRPVNHDDHPDRGHVGADIRLILPGDGCLLCYGNLVDYDQAVAMLLDPKVRSQADWRMQRAGSLRSLNEIAVGAAIHMVQDLVIGRLEHSTWLHIECDESGHLIAEYPSPHTGGWGQRCALCARAGIGDEGVISK